VGYRASTVHAFPASVALLENLPLLDTKNLTPNDGIGTDGAEVDATVLPASSYHLRSMSTATSTTP
jgi:hypothetical protein